MQGTFKVNLFSSTSETLMIFDETFLLSVGSKDVYKYNLGVQNVWYFILFTEHKCFKTHSNEKCSILIAIRTSRYKCSLY